MLICSRIDVRKLSAPSTTLAVDVDGNLAKALEITFSPKDKSTLKYVVSSTELEKDLEFTSLLLAVECYNSIK